MLLSAVAFIQDKKFFSSAPKEIQAVIKERPEELFPGARAIGWVLFILSVLMAFGVVVFSTWDGFNIKSQLLKLLVIFPMVSAFIAWICSLL